MRIEAEAPRETTRIVPLPEEPRSSLPPPDTIISPHAPVGPSKILDVFFWLFNLIRPLLFFLPKREAPLLPPSVKIEQAILTVETEHQKSSQTANLAIGVTFLCFTTWWTQSFNSVAICGAGKGFKTTAHVIDKVAQSSLPARFPHLKKAGSLALASILIWKAADALGYPQGIFYEISVLGSIFKVYLEARADSREKGQQRLHKILAG